jgi:hypothetical protein
MVSVVCDSGLGCTFPWGPGHVRVNQDPGKDRRGHRNSTASRSTLASRWAAEPLASSNCARMTQYGSWMTMGGCARRRATAGGGGGVGMRTTRMSTDGGRAGTYHVRSCHVLVQGSGPPCTTQPSKTRLVKHHTGGGNQVERGLRGVRGSQARWRPSSNQVANHTSVRSALDAQAHCTQQFPGSRPIIERIFSCTLARALWNRSARGVAHARAPPTDGVLTVNQNRRVVQPKFTQPLPNTPRPTPNRTRVPGHLGAAAVSIFAHIRDDGPCGPWGPLPRSGRGERCLNVSVATATAGSHVGRPVPRTPTRGGRWSRHLQRPPCKIPGYLEAICGHGGTPCTQGGRVPAAALRRRARRGGRCGRGDLQAGAAVRWAHARNMRRSNPSHPSLC